VSLIAWAIGLALLLIFIFALLSPFEALGWWAGWGKRGLEPSPPSDEEMAEAQETVAPYYIVYLTAIGGVSAEDISKRERVFLARLKEALPDAMIVTDVFPFSVTNNPLNGERLLGWLWRRIHQSRMKRSLKGTLFGSLIFLRNLLQVAVSADPRYGPINNVGVANEIAKSLVRHGYPLGSGAPIVVMGWSGGGQIAVGVARYLNQGLNAPVYVVSIGGVLTDDPAVAYVRRLLHIQGSKDKFPSIGDILYPGRWRIVPHSAWNRALAAGKIITVDPGPMIHTGRGDYFDYRATLANGQTHVERIVELIADFIRPIQDVAQPA